MHTDEGADDLEVISPLGGGEAGAPLKPAARVRRNRLRVLACVCGVVIFMVGLLIGVALGRRDTNTPRSFQGSAAPLGPARAALTTTFGAPSSTLAPPRRGRLRALFTHVSPTGAVVIASAGLVSLAEAQECPVTATAPVAELPGCARRFADGVRFDFTAPGLLWYRLTVLTSRANTSALLQPVAGGPILVTRADGSTAVVDNPRLLLAAFRVKGPIAAVRVTLSDGTPETVTPIDGWAAIVGAGPGTRFPFRIGVDGLDASGRVIAKTQVLRCC